MRIIANISSYPPFARVGAWIATARYLRHAAERGHDVTALVTSRVAPYEVDGVSVRHTGDGLRPMIEHADVVVSHVGDWNRAHHTAYAVGTKSVKICHGMAGDVGRKITGSTGDPALVVFNSRSLQERCKYEGPSIVCRPHVDPDIYETKPGEKVTLVNLTENKGVATFSGIAKRMPHCPFLGVRGGYGRQKDPFRPNIELIGPVEDMAARVYSQTGILLMPSQRESWGLVAIEAACSGIPTIAHPTPGLTEALGDTGLYADRDDIDAWISHIDALADYDYYEMRQVLALERAHELAADNDLDSFVDALEALS